MSLRLWEELKLTLNERTDASKWTLNSFGSAWCREHRQKFPRLELTPIGDWLFEPVTGEWRDGMIAEAQLEHLEFDELRSYGVTTWIRLPEQSISYQTIARDAVNAWLNSNRKLIENNEKKGTVILALARFTINRREV